MAFSIQKEFLSHQLANHNKFNEKNTNIGRKQEKRCESNLETVRAFENQDFANIVFKMKGSTPWKSSGIICKMKEVNNLTLEALPSDFKVQKSVELLNLENSSNEIKFKIERYFREIIKLKNKLQTTKHANQNLNTENKILKQMLGPSKINKKCKLLLDSLKQLSQKNKITTREEEFLKSYIENLKNSTVSLGKELEKKKNIVKNEVKTSMKVEEPYEKILNERNRLRFQLHRIIHFEDRIKALKKKATSSDRLEMQLKMANEKFLNLHFAANKQLKELSENERLIKQLTSENYNIKNDIKKKIFDLSRTKCVEKDLETAKEKIDCYERMMHNYEFQLKEATNVLAELWHDKNCKNKLDEIKDYIKESVNSRVVLELTDLKKKEFENFYKLACSLDENQFLKDNLENFFQEVFAIIKYPDNCLQFNENDNDQSKFKIKLGILQDEILNLKKNYDLDIEMFKQQIKEILSSKAKTEEKLKNEIALLTEKLNNCNEIIIKQSAMVNFQRQKLQDKGKALEEQKKLVWLFEKDLEDEKLKIQNNQANILVLEKDYSNLKTMHNNVVKELKEKEITIQNIRKENVDLHREILSIEKDLKEKSNENNAVRISEFLDKISKLENELSKVKIEFDIKNREKMIKEFEKNKKNEGKFVVDIFAIQEIEFKKYKEFNDLLQEARNKLLKLIKRGNKKINSNASSLENITENLNVSLGKENKHKKINYNLETISDKNCKKPPPGFNKKLASVEKIENFCSEPLRLSFLAELALLHSRSTTEKKTKLQMICKKIFDSGVNCLTINELIYMHCFIYNASIKRNPEIMKYSSVEQCACNTFSCCLPNILREIGKSLDNRLKKMERDVEMLGKSLHILKRNLIIPDKACGDVNSKIFGYQTSQHKYFNAKSYRYENFDTPTRDNVA